MNAEHEVISSEGNSATAYSLIYESVTWQKGPQMKMKKKGSETFLDKVRSLIFSKSDK